MSWLRSRLGYTRLPLKEADYKVRLTFMQHDRNLRVIWEPQKTFQSTWGTATSDWQSLNEFCPELLPFLTYMCTSMHTSPVELELSNLQPSCFQQLKLPFCSTRDNRSPFSQAITSEPSALLTAKVLLLPVHWFTEGKLAHKQVSDYRADEAEIVIPWGAINLSIFLTIFGAVSFVVAWLHITEVVMGKEQAVSNRTCFWMAGTQCRCLLLLFKSFASRNHLL